MQRLVITPTQCQNQLIFLTDAQQHYLSRVLRLTSGDRFIAMDGSGNWYVSELDSSLRQAKIIESLPINTELPVAVTLMAAMPKGSEFERIVSQATELGVSCLIPLQSERTLLKPSTHKLERWRRISQEAAEQSERQFVPTITDPVEFTVSLTAAEISETHRYICVARSEAPHLLNCLLEQKLQQPSSLVIATGPEGGFSRSEIELAVGAGFQTVSLGNQIFRAVTAPIVALSLVASVFNRKKIY
ncbi:MAG: 16S rRNA (uracil(1498)-N(3))-methyltransferase [Coleofasciculaceae cyanobacterium]